MNTNLNHLPVRTAAGRSKTIISRSKAIVSRSKAIIASCALLLTLTLSSFTRPADKISSEVNSSFQKEFRNARIISYEISPNYTRLNFSMNDLVLSAFYSANGELLALTHNILTTQLPVKLMLGVKDDYSDYWVTGLFEMNSREENVFYLTLENANVELTLKSVNNAAWQIYNKTTKN